jgi:hypothetical protein
LALVTSGNVKAHNTSALQPINGPMGGPQEVDADNFSFSITLLIRICLFHFILAMCLLLFMYLVWYQLYVYWSVNDNSYCYVLS